MTRRRARVALPGGMTRDELLALPAVVPLWPTAGQAWGLKRNSTYELAQRGDFPCPVRRLGNRWVVVTEQLLESLDIHRTADMSEAGPATDPAAATTTLEVIGGPRRDKPATAPPRSA
jgi:predicted DNA-binding transcriptional regulator AlpA